MNPNFVYLNSLTDLSEDTFKELQKLSTFKRIKAHTVIVKTGEKSTKFYFLVSGIVRAYLTSECGKVYNKNIFSPINFIASFTGLITNKPSELAFETLTDCKVYEFDFKAFFNLCKKNFSVCLLYAKILEQVYIRNENRNIELLTLNATQRYLKLREQIHNIDDLIQQFQIASYLSITPVQLSRIRKELK